MPDPDESSADPSRHETIQDPVGREAAVGHGSGLRVAVIDDDEWIRRGRVEALNEAAEVERAVGVDHRAALQWTDRWDDIDVVLLDAHDEDGGWDRFSGVRVAQQIRARRNREQTRIVVVSGHSGNDLLRIRMAEAGADWIFSHRDVRTTEQLLSVLSADHGARLVSPLTARINPALALIDEGGDGEAFDRVGPQKSLPASRRRLITLRKKLGRILGQSEPPDWRSLVGFVNTARGSSSDDEREPPRPQP